MAQAEDHLVVYSTLTCCYAHAAALHAPRVPGVVQLCGTVDDAANMYLAFKPCSGGDLYKRLAHCGLLSEAQLCREVREMRLLLGRDSAGLSFLVTAGCHS